MASREEIKNQVKTAASRKSESELAAWIFKVGQEKGAATQLKMADLLTDDKGGFASLGQTILAQQSHKIAQWGDKSFPLSEKQCAVIAREFSAHDDRKATISA